MPNLLFKQLVVLSSQEGKARILPFHPTTTVLTGDNNTGKSALLKSLFRTFGTEPGINPNWKQANITSLVEFSIDQKDLFLLRQAGTYTIFDTARRPLRQFSSISRGLGPYLANLFHFGLTLNDKHGNSKTPTPGFFFLPYYFNQDRSWSNNWSAFEQLSQFNNWRKDLIEYHTGVRPNEFYETKGKQGQLLKEKDSLLAEQAILRNIKSELKEKLQSVAFCVNLDDFREEVTQLLVECEKLREAAEAIKVRLVRLHNERIDIEARIEIVKKSLKEINADYKFLQNSDAHIECPSCGAEYDNNFKEVFNIAIDEDKCEDLLVSLKGDLEKIKKKIGIESALHNEHEEAAARIQGLLALRREEVQLKDLIESESKKQVAEVLTEKAENLTKQLGKIEEKLGALKKRLAELTDKEVKERIVEKYRSLMKSFLFKLHVHGLNSDAYGDMTCKIKEDGSDLPRALLAYGFSILNVMREHTSSVFSPIVIDSPIQQEQDQKNHECILNFINECRPADSQLIIGVVDTKNVRFGGDTHMLTEEFSVMEKNQYKDARDFMEPFLQNSLLFADLNAED